MKANITKTVAASLKLVDLFLKNLGLSDALVSCTIRLLLLSIFHLRSTADEAEIKNFPGDEELGQLLNLLVLKMNRELEQPMPDMKKKDDLRKELKVQVLI